MSDRRTLKLERRYECKRKTQVNRAWFEFYRANGSIGGGVTLQYTNLLDKVNDLFVHDSEASTIYVFNNLGDSGRQTFTVDWIRRNIYWREADTFYPIDPQLDNPFEHIDFLIYDAEVLEGQRTSWLMGEN